MLTIASYQSVYAYMPAPVARTVRGGRPGCWVTHQLQMHLGTHLVVMEACSPPVAQELRATVITGQLPQAVKLRVAT